MSEVEQKEAVVSPVLQIIFIVVGVTILSLVLWRRLWVFRALEKHPTLYVFSPATVQKFGAIPHKITVGLHIDDFETFDVAKNKFTFAGTVWFLFYPGVISLEDLAQFQFLNATMNDRSPPNVSMRGDKFFVEYYINVSFRNHMNYAEFPFDDHRFHLMLINRKLLPDYALFDAVDRGFVVVADVNIFGWKFIDKAVRTGFRSVQLDELRSEDASNYPAATFMLDYSQFSIRYIITLLLPLLLMCYVALSSFSLARERSVSVISGAVTALLAYRFVIEALSPRVGYFMIIDYVFLFFLLISVLTFFMIVLEAYIRIPRLFKTGSVMVFHTIIIIGLSYLMS